MCTGTCRNGADWRNICAGLLSAIAHTRLLETRTPCPNTKNTTAFTIIQHGRKTPKRKQTHRRTNTKTRRACRAPKVLCSNQEGRRQIAAHMHKRARSAKTSSRRAREGDVCSCRHAPRLSNINTKRPRACARFMFRTVVCVCVCVSVLKRLKGYINV